MTRKDATENRLYHFGRQKFVTVPVTLISVFLILWLIADGFTPDLKNRLELFGILVNSLLTIVLILVYSDIAKREKAQSDEAERLADLQSDQIRFQKDQTGAMIQQTDLQEDLKDIQERQQKMMEANHKPKLHIRNWNILSDGDSEDIISITLENKGNGLAENIRIRPQLRVLVETEGGELLLDVEDVLSRPNGDERINSAANPLVANTGHIENSVPDNIDNRDYVLEAGERSTLYSRLEYFRSHYDDFNNEVVEDGRLSISKVMKKIGSEDQIHLTFEIMYCDILGDESSKTIYSGEVSKSEVGSLAELFNAEIKPSY